MSDMMPSVEAYFHEKIQSEIDSLTLQLTSGRCPDLPTYKHTVGKLQGYVHALEIFDDLIAHWKNQ